MKKIYLLFILAAFGTTGFAQTFTVSPSPVADMICPIGNEQEATIYFTNDQPNDVVLVWDQTDNTLNGAWSVSICDNNLCYFSAYPGDSMLPVANGSNGFLKFTCEIERNADMGSGHLKYNVHIAGDPTSGVEVTFNVNGVVSVTPSSFASQIKIGPNPVHNTLTMRAMNGSLEKGNAQVFDMSGKLLIDQVVRGVETTEIEVQTLPVGTYLLRYNSDKGIVTRRFVRQN